MWGAEKQMRYKVQNFMHNFLVGGFKNVSKKSKPQNDLNVQCRGRMKLLTISINSEITVILRLLSFLEKSVTKCTGFTETCIPYTFVQIRNFDFLECRKGFS